MTCYFSPLVPVTFVDYYRADYGDDLEFYFVFLRETILTSGQSVSMMLLNFFT